MIPPEWNARHCGKAVPTRWPVRRSTPWGETYSEGRARRIAYFHALSGESRNRISASPQSPLEIPRRPCQRGAMAALRRRRTTCSTARPCSSISTAPWSSWPRRPTRSGCRPSSRRCSSDLAPPARRPARHRQRPLARRSRAACAAVGHRLFRLARARAAARRRHPAAAERADRASTTCASGCGASPSAPRACWSRRSRPGSRSTIRRRRTEAERAAAFMERAGGGARLVGPARQHGGRASPARRDQGRRAARVHDGTGIQRRASCVRGRRPDRRTCFRSGRRARRRRHPGRAAAGDRGALSARIRSAAVADWLRDRRREQPQPLADRQLPGERAGRRPGGLRLGLPAARRRRSDVLRLARAEGRRRDCRAANGGSRSRTRCRPSSAISRTRRSWSTRLTDADGAVVEIFDFCPRFERSGRMYRPVAFVRIVRPIVGAPRIKVASTRRPTGAPTDAERTSGTNHIRYLLKPQPLRLTTDAPVIHLLEGRSFRLEKVAPFLPRPGRAVRRRRHPGAGDDAPPDRRPLARMGARPRHPARMAEGRDPRRDHAEAVPA